MKEYLVYADMTLVVAEAVSAESEERAREIALAKFNADPFKYARRAVACLDVEVTDVSE